MKFGPSILKSTTTVRFQDCDPFGHLNNARYIDYFLNARQDQVASYYDFEIMKFGAQPAESWVVSKTQIAYMAPAALMEVVSIQTRLIDVNESQLLVEGVMMDQAEQRVKSVAWMEFTYISLRTGRPAIHPEDLMQLFNTVRISDPIDTRNFDNRLAELKAVRVKTPMV
jgi:acyl-CoA thioester hydrolase